ncbi:MAG: hypothetical protein J0H02_08415 [Armatimonadetes bacterium]|nr:hypothetical protein [Armatimonadota bacterium]
MWTSVCVDDDLGYVYHLDETVLRDFSPPPRLPPTLDVQHSGFQGDHEGIAISTTRNGHGTLVYTDQIEGDSVFDRISNRPLAR